MKRMMHEPIVISRHLLRRTARAEERKLQQHIEQRHYGSPSVYRGTTHIPAWVHGARVEPTVRGPFGWKVVGTENQAR